MAVLGSLALWLSLFVAIGAAVTAAMSLRRTGERFLRRAHIAMAVVTGLATMATLLLFFLLLLRDFQVAYVYQYTSTRLPLLYTLSAFWAGQEGSFLLWFWLVTLLALAVVSSQPRTSRSWPYLVGVLALTEVFFVLILVSTHDPFSLFPARPPEGLGMSPLLENPGMVIHPPVLFLGYAAYTVPFAFALAALFSREKAGLWVATCRRWSVLAWSALSAGILIGGWWSYVELGWGGYWAWDPVENASLIPWLLGTAFLHSTIIEERRGMHRVWNVWLATLPFVFCLFATLVTRGGIIVSDLHGFATAIQPVAYFLLGGMACALAATLVLSYVRRTELAEDHELDDLFSREGMFFLVNLLFCGAALLVLLGTAFPAVSQAVSGAVISLSASFYQRAVGPLLLAVVVLMGICPTLAWQRASTTTARNLRWSAFGALGGVILSLVVGVTEPVPLLAIAACAFVTMSIAMLAASDVGARLRSRAEHPMLAVLHLAAAAPRRYGAYVAHLGIVLITLGITGSSAFKTERLIALRPGDATQLGPYTIHYEDYSIETVNAQPVSYQSKVRYAATVAVLQGTKRLAVLVPERNDHWVLANPWVSEVAIHSTVKDDVYVVLAGLDRSGLASFHLALNPLVSWIWIGGAVLLVGGLMVASPSPNRHVTG